MNETLTIDEIKEKRLELKQKKLKMQAPTSFAEFLCFINSSYELKWFHKIIAEKCQALYEGRIKNLMVFIAPQHGKASDINTPVFTDKGWKKHGELKRGDYVFGQDGKRKMVLANTGEYEAECMKVTFANGQSVVVANEHEWRLMVEKDDKKGRREMTLETQNIFSIKHRRSLYIDIAPALEMEVKDLEIDPYMLGCWLGDGCSRTGTFNKGMQDYEYFSQYTDLGEIREIREENVFAFRVYGLFNYIKRAELYRNKHIPTEYLTASREQRLALLQGLMDTDGCCDTRGNCEFCQKEGRLADDVYTLICSLGYKPNRYVLPMKLYGRAVGTKVRICFCPDRNDKVFRMPRKAERLRNKTNADRDDKKKFFIKSIEPAGRRMVNCIQVEDDMYLISEHFIPTHNSEIVSRNFPAWAFGRNPDLKIVGCSYSADLADQFSRAIQRTIDSEEYSSIFPETYLNGSGTRESVKGYLRNVDIFEMVNHKGFYKAVGIGGGLTGTPVDIAIIDDPVKDANEANSMVYRQRVWDWYNTVLTTRLHNNSRQLFIMTRWHEDDLAGRILKAEPNNWEVLSIPAICEERHDGGISEREVGESLWEERHSIEKLLRYRERAPREFNSLYQQHPTIEGGNIVKREWFRRMSAAEFKAMRFNDTMHFYLDTAYNKKKVGADNDPSGILCACRMNNDIYLVDAQKVYKEMPDLLRFIPEYMDAHNADKKSTLNVEPKANGLSVIQMLRECTTLNVRETDTPRDSKEVRLRAVSPRIECGRVYLVEGSWNEDFLNEVCGFPNAPHDEFVDILGYAINDLYDEGDIDYEELDKYMFGL